MTDAIEARARITTKAICAHYGLSDGATCLALVRAALREVVAETTGTRPPVPPPPPPAVAPPPPRPPSAPIAPDASRRAVERFEPVMPFGRRRGEKLSAVDVSDLRWIEGRLVSDVTDDDRSQWREKNMRLLEQVRAELARREQ